MAKLSANGTEVARYVRAADKATLDKHIHDAKTELSVRSNGWVLRRVVTWFVDVYRPDGVRYVNHGWKRWQKLSARTELGAELDAMFTGWGYTKVVDKAPG